MNIMQAIKRFLGVGSADPSLPPSAAPTKKVVLARARAAIEEAEKTCEVFDRDSSYNRERAGVEHPAGV